MTYSTLLSLIPVLTIAFSVLQAFPAFDPVEEQIRALITQSLVPQAGGQVTEYLEGFARQAGNLTAVGIIGLMVTSVLLLSNIDNALNTVWRVERRRSLKVRVPYYWMVLTVVPLLLGVGLSLGVTLDRAVVRAGLEGSVAAAGLELLETALPALMMVAAVTLVFRAIPNREVAVWDAVVGAVVVTVLSHLGAHGFTAYVRAFPAYQTIYGALAAVPITLIWLYLVWASVMVGAVVAAALPDWRAGRARQAADGAPEAAGAEADLSRALVLLARLEAARRGTGMALPDDEGDPGVLAPLEALGWVARTEAGVWVLTRDLDTVTLYDLAVALGWRPPAASEGPGQAKEVLVQAADAMRRSLDVALGRMIAR